MKHIITTVLMAVSASLALAQTYNVPVLENDEPMEKGYF